MDNMLLKVLAVVLMGGLVMALLLPISDDITGSGKNAMTRTNMVSQKAENSKLVTGDYVIDKLKNDDISSWSVTVKDTEGDAITDAINSIESDNMFVMEIDKDSTTGKISKYTFEQKAHSK